MFEIEMVSGRVARLTESREAAFAPPGPQRSPGRLTRSKTSSSGTPCVKPTNACETHRQSPKVTGCGPAGGGPFPCILNQENGACPAPGDVCCRASSAHDYGGSNRNEIKIMGALLITHHMGFPFCFPSPPPPCPLPSLGGENTLRKHLLITNQKGYPFCFWGGKPPLTGRSGRLRSGWCSKHRPLDPVCMCVCM